MAAKETSPPSVQQTSGDPSPVPRKRRRKGIPTDPTPPSALGSAPENFPTDPWLLVERIWRSTSVALSELGQVPSRLNSEAQSQQQVPAQAATAVSKAVPAGRSQPCEVFVEKGRREMPGKAPTLLAQRACDSVRCALLTIAAIQQGSQTATAVSARVSSVAPSAAPVASPATPRRTAAASPVAPSSLEVASPKAVLETSPAKGTCSQRSQAIAVADSDSSDENGAPSSRPRSQPQPKPRAQSQPRSPPRSQPHSQLQHQSRIEPREGLRSRSCSVSSRGASYPPSEGGCRPPLQDVEPQPLHPESEEESCPSGLLSHIPKVQEQTQQEVVEVENADGERGLSCGSCTSAPNKTGQMQSELQELAEGEDVNFEEETAEEEVVHVVNSSSASCSSGGGDNTGLPLQRADSPALPSPARTKPAPASSPSALPRHDSVLSSQTQPLTEPAGEAVHEAVTLEDEEEDVVVPTPVPTPFAIPKSPPPRAMQSPDRTQQPSLSAETFSQGNSSASAALGVSAHVLGSVEVHQTSSGNPLPPHQGDPADEVGPARLPPHRWCTPWTTLAHPA
eukprot:RCo020094